jgi:hypothetical protein
MSIEDVEAILGEGQVDERMGIRPFPTVITWSNPLARRKIVVTFGLRGVTSKEFIERGKTVHRSYQKTN